MNRCFRCHWLAALLLCGVLGTLGCNDDGKSSASSFGAGCNSNECKVWASDVGNGSLFGRTVGLDDDVMLVGSPTDSDAGTSAGAVYVFERDGEDWIEVQKLLADDTAADDLFGFAVAIRGDVAIVGAYGEDENGSGTGAAYVFRSDGTTWTQEAKLQPLDPVDQHGFGSSVGISGAVAVVGAPGDDSNGTAAGAAYAFRHDAGSWLQDQKLTASDGAAADQFGASVATDGSVISVGARLASVDPPDPPGTQRRGLQRRSGAGYVFRYDASWTEEAKIVGIREPIECEATAGLTEVNDSWTDGHFGTSTSIDGELLAFGAPRSKLRVPPASGCSLRPELNETGAAYIYRFDGDSSWDFQRRIIEADPEANLRLGVKVDIRDGGTGGTKVLAIGAPGSRDLGVGSGKGYYVVYDTTIGEWPLVPVTVLPSDGSEGDRFGDSVAAQDDMMVFGATGDDSGGVNSGAVYVYPVE
ncbi:MAG: FG-GAP repeat protein [Myxococcota bacterium]|nr:FG-GAP repeat protein [Myxococcota bacterium]